MNRYLAQQSETIKQKLLDIPYVQQVSSTANLPIHLQSGSVVDDWRGVAIPFINNMTGIALSFHALLSPIVFVSLIGIQF